MSQDALFDRIVELCGFSAYVGPGAVRRALKRRGMDETHRLDVELVGRFRLVPTTPEGKPSPQESGGLPPGPGAHPTDL